MVSFPTASPRSIGGGQRSTTRSLLVLLIAISLTGCGQAVDGPSKFSLTGTVSFDDKPVPKGFITFVPDGDKGNKGPGSGAPIVDGKFETPDAMGHIGGAHTVEIVGYDGVPTTVEGESLPDGTPLFAKAFLSADLPKEDGTMDFEVPKDPAPK